MMKRLLVMFFIMGAYMSNVSASDVYHYDNYALDAQAWSLPYSYMFDLKNGFLDDPTNERVKIKTCEDDSLAVCYSSQIFNFSIPKKELKDGLEWSTNGEQFKLLKTIDLFFLGMKIHCKIVESTRSGGMKVTYFYSQEKGVVAFSLLTSKDQVAEMYWLRELQGIGAAK